MRMAADPYDITPGSHDPHLRLRDMDLMGIDQAMLLPTFCGMWFTAIEDAVGALGLARAYNNWILDHAAADATRLFPAMIFPQHDNDMAVAEIHRGAELGFRCAIVRPNIVAGRYPAHPSFDPIWQALSDTGMVAGLHPFPPANGKVPEAIPNDCCGWFIDEAAQASAFERRGLISETICFAHDAQTLLLLLFHQGFYDRFPGLKLAVLESNAAWLPSFLDKAESRVVTWTATRGTPVTRLPTTAFREQSFVSFESDERLVFRLWDEFVDIGVWASDYPHFDAEDAWEAIGHMREAGVPADAMAKLMGGNAARMYGIEPRLVVREQALVPS
jgi:predicted TIM-barrel fold metal-dependent hydrolase